MALRQAASTAFRARDVGSSVRHVKSLRGSLACDVAQSRTLLVPYLRCISSTFPDLLAASYSSRAGDDSSSNGSRRNIGDRKSRGTSVGGNGDGAAASGGSSDGGGDGGNKDLLKCPKCGESCIHVETFVCKSFGKHVAIR